MVLGHAATAVIALQHRHVAVACVVVWAWHVCVGRWGGLEKTVSGHAMHTPGTHQAHTRHTPGTHQAHARQAHIMHMPCTHDMHTLAMHTPLITCQWHMLLKNLQHKINRTQQKP